MTEIARGSRQWQPTHIFSSLLPPPRPQHLPCCSYLNTLSFNSISIGTNNYSATKRQSPRAVMNIRSLFRIFTYGGGYIITTTKNTHTHRQAGNVVQSLLYTSQRRHGNCHKRWSRRSHQPYIDKHCRKGTKWMRSWASLRLNLNEAHQFFFYECIRTSVRWPRGKHSGSFFFFFKLERKYDGNGKANST